MDKVVFNWHDILVDTKTLEEHMMTFGELFKSLTDAHLTVRPSKCILGTDNVDFIGGRLSEGLKGLREDILEKPDPVTLGPLRFMGQLTTKNKKDP